MNDEEVTAYGMSMFPPAPSQMLDVRCTEGHGWDCCGCLGHPEGKPWHYPDAWEEHWNATPGCGDMR